MNSFSRGIINHSWKHKHLSKESFHQVSSSSFVGEEVGKEWKIPDLTRTFSLPFISFSNLTFNSHISRYYIQRYVEEKNTLLYHQPNFSLRRDVISLNFSVLFAIRQQWKGKFSLSLFSFTFITTNAILILKFLIQLSLNSFQVFVVVFVLFIVYFV